ncbi:shikimate kinase [Lentisphaera araneosa HTCC2155]|uniref:Shikimate kinase n=1 Tax=Lentisphaera araneosa HTCC2155 TaxID=313628 RepID=A6DMF7_9BACT|nr:shikimate kinase [Lentisphaera araneosa]EDM27147.1 shikimate kinase [Lentisphaera araneosa HTCC2155]
MNIILIGFMASGKSSLGRYMATRTKRQVIDLDHEIEEKAQMSIPKIFETVGEKAFRDLESYVTKLCKNYHNTIVATGGGCILRKENRDALKQAGLVVWLNTSPENVQKYTAKRSNRPLLKGEKSLEEIESMMKAREEFYADASHLKIDVFKHNLEEIFEIIQAYKDQFLAQEYAKE